MLSPQLSILRKINPDKRKPLKILTVPTHEGYQSMLAETGQEFYMVTGPGLKGWDFHTRALPRNHFIHGPAPNELRSDTKYDMVLCQNRMQQYQLLRDVANKLGLPLVVLDHTEKPPGITASQFKELKQWTGDVNVYITEHNKKSWEASPEAIVIPHGINTEVFKGYTGEVNRGITIVNHFASRDIFCGWNLYGAITKEIPCDLVGENPGLSKSINKVDDLVKEICKHRFYLNTSQLSPVPLSMLEAMSCGIPVVSSRKQEIPKIITHGINGYLYDTPLEAIAYCNILRENQHGVAETVGEKGRQTVIDKFGIKAFAERWNKVFTDLYESKR